jgi:hypothetical protein
MGTSEHRHDAYDPALTSRASSLGIDPTILRDAVVLREILQKR